MSEADKNRGDLKEQCSFPLAHPASRASRRGVLKIRNKQLAWGARTYLMGVLNTTPDSFSGDGVVELDAAVLRGLDLIEAGADILDIGAESTRPGHAPVDAETELKRLLLPLEQLRQKSDAIISVDTTKPEVFTRALAAGADILNSVQGLNDPELFSIVLERQIPVVIMHNKEEARYDGNVVDEVLRYLDSQAKAITDRGMPPHTVILDPGIGFGKTPDHNIEILASLHRLVGLGFPTLLGTSRKSTIGKLTGRPVSDRLYGTAATVALAIAHGIDVVRVHDVNEMRQVVEVSDAIIRGWRPPHWPGEKP